ncbi:MAG: hypothetical protein U0L11_00040 [Acutalibacteraceae bacterium]|nr:hypothetical protein [Acutalibacteraceae bacterium]
MVNKKSKQANLNKNYIVSSVVLWSLIITSFFLHLKFQKHYITIFTGVLILIWMLSSFYFVFKKWLCFIEDLMNEYTTKNNLFSGMLAIVFVFLTIALLPSILSYLNIPNELNEFQNIFVNVSIAAMSSIIGILGVQYSIAVQEKNRKEDLRYGAKPYILTTCFCKEKFVSENGHTYNRFIMQADIENISQNIAIPIGCKLTEDNSLYLFKYIPMNNGAKRTELIEIDNQKPIVPKCSVDIYYKDVLNNIYKQTIIFDMHNGIKMSNCSTKSDLLCSDEEKDWINSYLQS